MKASLDKKKISDNGNRVVAAVLGMEGGRIRGQRPHWACPTDVSMVLAPKSLLDASLTLVVLTTLGKCL